MSVDFIAQPHHAFRIGDFLERGFTAGCWTEFRAAVAFVKRSGTKHVRGALEAFSKGGGKVSISAGIDAQGTSKEGLTDLMKAVEGRDKVFVFKNANRSTFHPKIYLFRNAEAAEIVIGSGNLTEGGLFTNYEASLLLQLKLANARDVALLTSITEALDSWVSPKAGLCYALDAILLERLVQQGFVPDEVHAWGDEKPSSEKGKIKEPLFASYSVQSAPNVHKQPIVDVKTEDEPAEPYDESLEVAISSPVSAQSGHHKVFLMTLQQTDVGIGQTTKGASRRSPEIFIPLIARDLDPAFWGWPDLFASDTAWSGPTDKDGRGKMDRPGVMVRLGGATFPVHFWYNPDKRDLRLRSEHMRSAGGIGDILYVERSDGKDGFSYYVDVVPQSSPRHAELLPRCNHLVRNSKKLFGYL